MLKNPSIGLSVGLSKCTRYRWFLQSNSVVPDGLPVGKVVVVVELGRIGLVVLDVLVEVDVDVDVEVVDELGGVVVLLLGGVVVLLVGGVVVVLVVVEVVDELGGVVVLLVVVEVVDDVGGSVVVLVGGSVVVVLVVVLVDVVLVEVLVLVLVEVLVLVDVVDVVVVVGSPRYPEQMSSPSWVQILNRSALAGNGRVIDPLGPVPIVFPVLLVCIWV